ncbi:MAG: hypothetical protein HY903_05405, partial [Deltaproteobacteria bacterium]|nr:hypothetical protein [Deltaproteobacteria bacterium]
DIVIPITSADATEGTVTSTAPLTFTSADWSTPQVVTVTGANDQIDDADVLYTITVANPTAGDANYLTINPADVTATNNDDADAAGITVSPTSGLVTTEAGGTATFSVVLTSQPVADIVIPITSADASEGTVTSTVPLTFTSGDWSTPKVVTVTGADDIVQDPAAAYTITVANPTSGDGNYLTINPADVSVTNNETGTNGVPVIAQASFTVGKGVLVSVTGDTDEYANANAGGGNDPLTVSVTLSTPTDSEAFYLPESFSVAGAFDCTVDGCLYPTVKLAGSGTVDNGVLEIDDTAGNVTVTLTYIDALRVNGATSFSVQTTATAVQQAGCVANIVINEVVTAPQQDWSSTGFTSAPGGTGNADDEWIELYNAGSCTVDLTSGFLLQMMDGTDSFFDFVDTSNGQVMTFSGSSTAAAFAAGDYLVIGDASGAGTLADDIWIRLDEPLGGVVNSAPLGVTLGGDGDGGNNAPSGAATGTSDEAIYRVLATGNWAGTGGTATIRAVNP